MADLDKILGAAPGLSRRELGSPTGGLNNKIEGIIRCIITQSSVKNSQTDKKFFPDGGGGGGG